MPKVKLNKHEIYKMIAEHLDWFDHWDIENHPNEMRFISCNAIETNINRYLKKGYDISLTDPKYNPPFIRLYGQTLSAMVDDGMLERRKYPSDHAYRYRPVLPIDEEYFA